MDFTQYKSNTYNKGACYVLPDGSFLNMCEMTELMKCRKANHRTLDFYLERHGQGHGRRILKYKQNAIAINDGSNFDWENAYIDLPPNPITSEQYDSILKYLDYLMTVSPIVEIGFNRAKFKKYDFVSLNNDQGYLPEDILKEIKRLYN